MKVPDKIYISPNIENRTWLIGKGDIVNIEYIRKDILLQWAKELVDNTLVKSIELVYQAMIDKIESL